MGQVVIVVVVVEWREKELRNGDIFKQYDEKELLILMFRRTGRIEDRLC